MGKWASAIVPFYFYLQITVLAVVKTVIFGGRGGGGLNQAALGCSLLSQVLNTARTAMLCPVSYRIIMSIRIISFLIHIIIDIVYRLRHTYGGVGPFHAKPANASNRYQRSVDYDNGWYPTCF